MILNFAWTIPAWILLALHFILHISIFWFIGALLIWALTIIIWMLLVGWAVKLGKEPVKENKNINPYSNK